MNRACTIAGEFRTLIFVISSGYGNHIGHGITRWIIWPDIIVSVIVSRCGDKQDTGIIGGIDSIKHGLTESTATPTVVEYFGTIVDGVNNTAYGITDITTPPRA